MLVLVSIVTYNDEAFIEKCLASVKAQTVPIRVRILDNDSMDATVQVAARAGFASEQAGSNLGYSAGHNRNVRDEVFDAVLFLNADVILESDYVERLLAVLKEVPAAGMAGGKLLRMDGAGRQVFKNGRPVIDSTGIYMTPSQRHFDRGSESADTGQYDRRQLVFGITGAALLCRRVMLEDLGFGGRYFDEDFFAYREDADLAWRAQLRGWGAVYEPAARALHCRRVFPRGRRRISAAINRHSLRNRYLMRKKNIGWAVRRRCFPAMWLRDTGIFVYALLLERSSLPAYVELWRLRGSFKRKRALIQSSRRVSDREIARWFSFRPQARDV